jgi:hypothetical protein
MVSQNLAERLFGNANPIGRTMFLGPLAYRNLATIIGEVNNASLWKVESPAPMAYFRPITKTWDDATLSLTFGPPWIPERSKRLPNKRFGLWAVTTHCGL